MRTTVFFDLTETADDKFDHIIEMLLVTLLAFAPLALGVVQAWSETIFIALAAGMSLCLGLKLLYRRDLRFVWSWTYIPVALFLLLCAAQLVSLPASILRTLSPHTVQLRTLLLGSAPMNSIVPAAAQRLHRMPLSFYPEGTWHDLRLLLAIAAVYVVTLNVIRQATQVQRLLLCMTVIGAGVALIGIAHIALGASRIYGLVGRSESVWVTGPFVNRNHFGQFMNLSLGAASAVLLARLEQFIHGFRRSRLPQQQMIAHVPRMVWLTGAAAVLCAAGVFLSLSRGAMISLSVSAALAAVVAWRVRMRVRVWAMIPLVWLLLLVVIYFGFNALAGRLTHLQEHSVAARLELARDVMVASRQFPLLGMGMGSFEVAYPRFDRSNWASLATHADNDYAQLLFETGWIGMAIAVCFVAMIVWKYMCCVRSAPSPMASIAIGLGLGLGSILLHSASDFGQHIPACAAFTAVFYALLVNLSQASRRAGGTVSSAFIQVPVVRNRIWQRAARAAWVIAVLIVSATSIAIVADSLQRARAEWAWFSVRHLEPVVANHNWQAPNNDWARLLIAADRASELAPDDIHYRYRLNYYRWKQISQIRDPQSGQIIMTPQQLEWAGRIVAELLQGVWSCPTHGPSYLLAGQIDRNVLLEHDQGAELIRAGYRLSRTDPIANFEAALLDAQEGQWDPAMAKFEHAAQLDPTYRREAIRALVSELNRADLAMRLAGTDIPAMREVVAALSSSATLSSWSSHAQAMQQLQQARQRLDELVLARAEVPDASADALEDAARLCMSRQQYAQAASYLRRALHLKLASAQLHLELAEALQSQGLREQAIEEARTARQLGSESAEQLIRKWQYDVPATSQSPSESKSGSAASAPAGSLGGSSRP